MKGRRYKGGQGQVPQGLGDYGQDVEIAAKPQCDAANRFWTEGWHNSIHISRTCFYHQVSMDLEVSKQRDCSSVTTQWTCSAPSLRWRKCTWTAVDIYRTGLENRPVSERRTTWGEGLEGDATVPRRNDGMPFAPFGSLQSSVCKLSVLTVSAINLLTLLFSSSDLSLLPHQDPDSYFQLPTAHQIQSLLPLLVQFQHFRISVFKIYLSFSVAPQHQTSFQELWDLASRMVIHSNAFSFLPHSLLLNSCLCFPDPSCTFFQIDVLRMRNPVISFLCSKAINMFQLVSKFSINIYVCICLPREHQHSLGALPSRRGTRLWPLERRDRGGVYVDWMQVD